MRELACDHAFRTPEVGHLFSGGKRLGGPLLTRERAETAAVGCIRSDRNQQSRRVGRRLPVRAVVDDGVKTGVEIVAIDHGPGIADVAAVLGDDALNGSWRPSGIGLAGARRLMDEFDIVSTLGRGTTVTMKKWKVDR